MLLPTVESFGEAVIVQTDAKNYTAADWRDLFADVGLETTVDMYDNILGTGWTLSQLPPPAVPTYLHVSTGLDTPYTFVYPGDITEPGYDRNPSETAYSDGDGTVNRWSLDWPATHWVTNETVEVFNFTGVSHAGMVTNDAPVASIVAIVTAEYP